MKRPICILFLYLVSYSFPTALDFPFSRPACRQAWLLPTSPFLLPLTSISYANPQDGFALEGSQLLTRGVWDIGFGVDFASGAEVVDGPFVSAKSKDALAVDWIRVPLEMRYGMTDRTEIGSVIAFESDNGKTFPAGNNAPGTYFSASGIQGMQIFGKWKLGSRLAWRTDLAFLGNNALAGGNDGLDLGVKFMYTPKMGPGWMLVNLGVDIKSGAGDFNDNGVSGSAEDYQNPINFGVGYLFPVTRRISATAELAGGTSQFSGGGAFGTNNRLDALVGLRAAFSDRFYMTGGAGFGVLAGSPNVSVRLGVGWMLGAVERFASSQSQSDWWTPTPELEKQVAEEMAGGKAAGAKLSGKAGRGRTKEEMLADRISLANDAFARRDYVAAAAHYEAAVTMNPNDPVVQYNLATAYFLLRRYADARNVYKSVVRLTPDDVDSHLYLGYTYYYLKDVESAAREWKTVLTLDPANETARQNIESMEVQ